MKIVGMDTSYQYLNIALLDEGYVDGCMVSCFKQQSEWMIPKWKELMDRNGWNPKEIDGIVVTQGPGSYTGVRIAMTVAKMVASSIGCKLYTVSSLQLLAGNCDHAIAVMDARGKRAYVGEYKNGKAMKEDCILTLEELQAYVNANPDVTVVGDGHLVGKEDVFGNMPKQFDLLRSEWKEVTDIDDLCPKYLKDNDEYLVNV